MIAVGDGLAVGQDFTTALCGGFNTLYFLVYALRRSETLRRRIGAAALALVNGGALVESVYLLAVYLSLRLGSHDEAGLLAPGPWLLARCLPFVGTASVLVLILRSLNHRAGG